MIRHLDRARGVLNLLLLLSCFSVYAGHLLRTESSIAKLFVEWAQLVDVIDEDDFDDEEEGVKLNDMKSKIQLKQLLQRLDLKTDLSWLSPEEIHKTIIGTVGMQGKHPELSSWLNYQLKNAESGINLEDLPRKFYPLFQTEKKTKVAARIYEQLNKKFNLLKDEVGSIGTVEDFIAVDEPTLKLYGLNVPVSATSALTLFALFSGLLSLYLYSLLVSVANEVEYLEKREGTDLVLFHPGVTSYLLFLFWLLFPALIGIYNYYTIEDVASEFLICLVVTTAILVITYFKGLNCRKLLFAKLAEIQNA